MSLPSKLFHGLKTGFIPSAARRSRWRAMARHIMRMGDALQGLSDEELLTRGRKVRWEAQAGVALDKLLPEAYALIRESARRVLGMQHFEVQIMGAIALFEGHIAEMQTGEGKTLTATMPSFLRALRGQGCHVVTVNDYLANRDADTMGPVHVKLGVTVGKILDSMEPDERRKNYACDITYGTSKEMGFDFLRDRLRKGAMSDEGGSQIRLSNTYGDYRSDVSKSMRNVDSAFARIGKSFRPVSPANHALFVLYFLFSTSKHEGGSQK